MKHYLGDSFPNKYLKYLIGVENDPYQDIDSTGAKNISFYNDLTKFLNVSVNTVLNEFKFKSPHKTDYPFAITLSYKNSDHKINEMKLTSDIFGFSAPSNGSNGGKSGGNYPYGNYLSLAKKEKDENKVDKCFQFVNDCVFNTRSIGGSFIWPKVKLEKHRAYDEIRPGWHSIYNYYRGAYGYIQDRVDLTLYEIKCFYDIYKDYKEYKDFLFEYRKKYPKNIMFIYPNKRGKPIYTPEEKEQEMKEVFKWLSLFENFSKYINIFCFTPFVKETDNNYEILDIYGVKNESVLPVDSNNLLDRKKLKDIQKMNLNELHNLLSNVTHYIVKRSKMIEERINNKLFF